MGEDGLTVYGYGPMTEAVLDRLAEDYGVDPDDGQSEFADMADDYHADLLAWVGSHGERATYCDEARDEFGEPRGFYHGIQMGSVRGAGRGLRAGARRVAGGGVAVRGSDGGRSGMTPIDLARSLATGDADDRALGGTR